MLAPVERENIFKAEQLTIDYGASSVTPIQNLNLAIRAGEITCVLGRSGCGKTSLLKALGGFIVGAPTGGVLFDGQYLAKPVPEIVMIFQENNLYPWLNVRENIGFALKFRPSSEPTRSARAAAKTAAVDAMLEAVGLTEAAHAYPHQLSGGMRQRTALARALITDPHVLLLDEPFSALDVGLRRRMLRLMDDLWNRMGMTMVMVTHNIEEAIQIGHRVIVLGGRPAEVLMDIDTSAPEMRERYAPEFLTLQRQLEALIDQEDE
jgi:ABC-type nitrate/sulfonate/bicarbonate transport system ATPase subunit